MLELRPNVRKYWVTAGDMTQLFQSGEVVMGEGWPLMTNQLRQAKFPAGETIPKEGTIGLANCAGIPVGAKNKKLAYEFLNWRLDRDVQRAFHLGYFSSPGRPDITDWPKEFAETQIVTQKQMDATDFPDSEVIAAKRREWTMKWQEVMGT